MNVNCYHAVLVLSGGHFKIYSLKHLTCRYFICGLTVCRSVSVLSFHSYGGRCMSNALYYWNKMIFVLINAPSPERFCSHMCLFFCLFIHMFNKATLHKKLWTDFGEIIIISLCTDWRWLMINPLHFGVIRIWYTIISWLHCRLL